MLDADDRAWDGPSVRQDYERGKAMVRAMCTSRRG